MNRRFKRQPSGDEDRGGALPTHDDELSEEELLAESGQALPDRAALSTLDADVTIPVNPSLAADVLAGEHPGDAEEAVEGDDAVEAEDA